MIEQIVKHTIAPLIEKLNWVDQFGYLATRHIRRVEGNNGFSDVAYPIAKNVTGPECDNPDYANLNPDQRYRSLVMIEASGGMNTSTAPDIHQRLGLNFEQTILVKAWLNFPLIASDRNNELWFMADIIKVLHQTTFKNVSIDHLEGGVINPANAFHLNKMKVRMSGEMEHTPQAVFGAYDFSKDQALFMHDYGFFGLSFQLSGLLIMSCAPDIAYVAGVEC